MLFTAVHWAPSPLPAQKSGKRSIFLQSAQFIPTMPNAIAVPLKLEYPSCGIECAKEIENLIFRRELSPDDTAAVFVEPLQGEGGYIVPPTEFNKEVSLCQNHLKCFKFQIKALNSIFS